MSKEKTMKLDWDDADEQEARMVGMGLGVNAYNDARGMGLDVSARDCDYCLRPKERGHHGCYCDERN